MAHNQPQEGPFAKDPPLQGGVPNAGGQYQTWNAMAGHHLPQEAGMSQPGMQQQTGMMPWSHGTPGPSTIPGQHGGPWEGHQVIAMAPTAVQLQPSGPERTWDGGLCDCCLPSGDSKDGFCLCCQTCWCSCVTFAEIVQAAGLGSCGLHGTLYFFSTIGLFLLLFIIVSTAIYEASPVAGYLVELASIAIFLVSMGVYGGYFRGLMRQKFNLPGEACEDCMVHACCSVCSFCQEHRTITINVHNGVWTGPTATANLAVTAAPVHQVFVPAQGNLGVFTVPGHQGPPQGMAPAYNQGVFPGQVPQGMVHGGPAMAPVGPAFAPAGPSHWPPPVF